jgi:predicted nucleic acid-binding protein
MIPPEVFLDTAFALALANPNDVLHGRTTILADQLEAAHTRLITTRAILLEIGNSLAKLRYRAASVQLLQSLETDPNVEIIPLSDDLYERAFQLYQQRPDKEWSLTDCISFVVMQDRGLTHALTPDKHFQQAGHRALLRDATE